LKESITKNKKNLCHSFHEQKRNPTENLLPFDGTVNYFGKIIPLQEANYYYDILIF
jgi:hypothetical protein